MLNNSGLALAGTVSVLKVRRTIRQENFLVPLRIDRDGFIIRVLTDIDIIRKRSLANAGKTIVKLHCRVFRKTNQKRGVFWRKRNAELSPSA
jgi:hypothetical protein